MECKALVSASDGCFSTCVQIHDAMRVNNCLYKVYHNAGVVINMHYMCSCNVQFHSALTPGNGIGHSNN